MSARMRRLLRFIARKFSIGANRCSTCWKSFRPANCRSTPISKCCRCSRRAITRSPHRPRAMPRVAASPSAWSRARRARVAASIRACARTISRAAGPARPFTLPSARPRPASACPMIAPFRGFLQERGGRKAKGATLGPAMLFFGCRHPQQDFIYADELKAFAADGITELFTAFSRADTPKTYVQHLAAAEKDKVWQLIEQGAVIFVCGDGGKMEPDVKAALVAIYRERSGADAADGARWIEDMGAKNRYVLDVWAAG